MEELKVFSCNDCYHAFPSKGTWYCGLDEVYKKIQLQDLECSDFVLWWDIPKKNKKSKNKC